MKCPKCGVHYDDGDKECPMCGAARPFLAKDKSQLAQTTARLATPSKAAQKDLKEFYNPDIQNAQKHEKKRMGGMGSILDLGASDKDKSSGFPSSKPKNGGKGAGKIVIIIFIIFVLVNILPIIIGAVNMAITTAGDSITAITDEISTPEPDEEYFPYGGMWTSDTGELSFGIVPEDSEFYYPSYTVSIGDYIELGGYYAENANIYDWNEIWNTLDIDEYNAWTVTLFPERAENLNSIGITMDDFFDYQENYAVLAFCSKKDNPDEIFLYNVYDVPWLEEGEMVPVTMTIDGEEYAKILSESEY